MRSSRHLARAEATLREFALTFPEAIEEFPWGHRAMKVRAKSFAFLALGDETLSLSVKLPHSSVAALTLPFASPTRYGLGRSGWVTARFEGKAEVPVDLLEQWIDESYRAIAPKRLVATLGDEPLVPRRSQRRKAHAVAPPTDSARGSFE
jgi:predicted DNA-binding protein (MmcQ/YjbR family)